MIFLLLAVIGGCFILQSFLGFWQIKNFNYHYRELKSEGKVAIGRSKGIVRTGVVLLIAVDNQARIKEAKKMQGLTVFARFKEAPELQHENLMDIPEEKIDNMNRFYRKAIWDAQHVYRLVQAGHEVPKPSSPAEKILSVFTRKKQKGAAKWTG